MALDLLLNSRGEDKDDRHEVDSAEEERMGVVCFGRYHGADRTEIQ